MSKLGCLRGRHNRDCGMMLSARAGFQPFIVMPPLHPGRWPGLAWNRTLGAGNCAHWVGTSAGPKARKHTSLGHRPRFVSPQVRVARYRVARKGQRPGSLFNPGPTGDRAIEAWYCTGRAGFQPCVVMPPSYPGRWPGLIWGRTFGASTVPDRRARRERHAAGRSAGLAAQCPPRPIRSKRR